jgi:hypothetical protein
VNALLVCFLVKQAKYELWILLEDLATVADKTSDQCAPINRFAFISKLREKAEYLIVF